MRARLILFLALLLGAPASVLSEKTFTFAVIGDSGTGGSHQKLIAGQMLAFHQNHSWKFILMLGDNIYEGGDPKDFDKKFKNIYEKLNVPFHATLGNHDRRTARGQSQVEDDAFGYVGKQDEYEFHEGPQIGGKRLARFICLNSGAWKEKEDLSRREKSLDKWLSKSPDYHWNFVFFHHPIYSFVYSNSRLGWLIGRWGHGSNMKLRKIWEQSFIDGGIDIVLSGHDHFYQKIRKQKGGIHYFVSGGAGKIRKGIKKNHPEVEFGKVTYHFLHFEVSEKEVRFAAVDEDGNIFHRGCIRKDEKECSAQSQERKGTLLNNRKHFAPPLRGGSPGGGADSLP